MSGPESAGKTFPGNKSNGRRIPRDGRPWAFASVSASDRLVGINNQLDAVVPLLAGRGGVGNHRMVAAMADGKELHRRDLVLGHQVLVDRHRAVHRELVIAHPWRSRNRV